MEGAASDLRVLLRTIELDALWEIVFAMIVLSTMHKARYMSNIIYMYSF